jgi:hypothetical protein
MTWTISFDNGDVISGAHRRDGEPISQQVQSERIQFPGSQVVSIYNFGKMAPVVQMSFVGAVSTEGEMQAAKAALERAHGQFATLNDVSNGESYRVRIAGMVQPVLRRGAASFGGVTYGFRVEFDLPIEVMT